MNTKIKTNPVIFQGSSNIFHAAVWKCGSVFNWNREESFEKSDIFKQEKEDILPAFESI